MKKYIVKSEFGQNNQIKISIYEPKDNIARNDALVREYMKYNNISTPIISVEVPDDMTKEKFIEEFKKHNN